MKIVLTLEIKRSTKKKSPAPKTTAQSNSQTNIIVNHK